MPITLEDVRSVQWSQSFRWEVLFEPGPSGFNKWFPATEVSENVWSLIPYEFEAGQNSFSFPLKTSEATVEVTFIDDVKLHVETWLTQWVNEIIQDGHGGMLRLPMCMKKLEVRKFDNMNREIYSATYNVYPKGEMFYHGTSEANPLSDAITFVVVEIINISHS